MIKFPWLKKKLSDDEKVGQVIGKIDGIKLCINCKYFDNSKSSSPKYAKCAHPEAIQIKTNSEEFYVTGIPEPSDIHYCSTMRSSFNMCGKEGKFYEEKV